MSFGCERITIISLVNTHHHTKLQFFFFLMINPLKIYYFNFQRYNMVQLTIITRLYIKSPGLNFFYNWKFVLFDPLNPFCPLPTPTLPQPPVCYLYLWTYFYIPCLFACLFCFVLQIPCITEIIQYLPFSI